MLTGHLLLLDVMLYTAEVEMRAGEDMSLERHQNTMSFHHEAALSPPMRSDYFILCYYFSEN